MKLKLSQENGIDILTLSEGIDTHDIQVLKAGITKIFKAGKNRIILELSGPGATLTALPAEVLRELARLDLLARELSGRVVLAGVSTELKVKIETFAVPPVILCFQTRVEALKFFQSQAPGAVQEGPPVPQDKKSAAIVAAPVATPATAPAPAPMATGAEVEKQVQVLKEEIRSREINELGALRKQIAILENENKALKEEVILLAHQRRAPADEASYQAKIQSLEGEIEKLMNEAKTQK